MIQYLDLVVLVVVPGRAMNDVILADAVDHGSVLRVRLQVRELEGERLLDPDLLLKNGNGVIMVIAFVQTTNL